MALSNAKVVALFWCNNNISVKSSKVSVEGKYNLGWMDRHDEQYWYSVVGLTMISLIVL